MGVIGAKVGTSVPSVLVDGADDSSGPAVATGWIPAQSNRDGGVHGNGVEPALLRKVCFRAAQADIRWRGLKHNRFVNRSNAYRMRVHRGEREYAVTLGTMDTNCGHTSGHTSSLRCLAMVDGAESSKAVGLSSCRMTNSWALGEGTNDRSSLVTVPAHAHTHTHSS